MLFSTDNLYFVGNYCARSHQLKKFRIPVYVEMYMSLLIAGWKKRYNMIHVGGKENKTERLKSALYLRLKKRRVF